MLSNMFVAKPVTGGSAALPQNLVAIAEQTKAAQHWSARVDQRLGTSDLLFGRFSTFDATEEQRFGTSVLQETLLPGFGRTVDTHCSLQPDAELRPSV
jgi:hypothetical protein